MEHAVHTPDLGMGAGYRHIVEEDVALRAAADGDDVGRETEDVADLRAAHDAQPGFVEDGRRGRRLGIGSDGLEGLRLAEKLESAGRTRIRPFGQRRHAYGAG